jgi:hypothetical protein
MLTANVEPVVKTTNLNLQFSVSPRPTAPPVSPKTYCTDYNEISADNGQNTLPIIQVSQKWRTNYLLPYPGGLNVHKKKYGKK